MTAEEAQAAAATCLQCKDPTCVAACPIRVDIPRYLEHVAVGDFAAAADVLLEHNPLPSVTSRVCEHENQCEGSCKRAKTEGVVPIGAIERFVAEWARQNRPTRGHARGDRALGRDRRFRAGWSCLRR